MKIMIFIVIMIMRTADKDNIASERRPHDCSFSIIPHLYNNPSFSSIRCLFYDKSIIRFRIASERRSHQEIIMMMLMTIIIIIIMKVLIFTVIIIIIIIIMLTADKDNNASERRSHNCSFPIIPHLYNNPPFSSIRCLLYKYDKTIIRFRIASERRSHQEEQPSSGSAPWKTPSCIRRYNITWYNMT